MSEIKATTVKALRERTGVGMMDCKKALIETNGDFEASIDWLRKKGLSAAAKKSDRVAAEGLTATYIDDSNSKGVTIEINSETDFVGQNEKFQKLVKDIAELALKYDNLQELKVAKTASGRTVEEEINENIAIIGENLVLRRVDTLKLSKKGIIGAYVHNEVAKNLGKIAVLVSLESETKDLEKLALLAKNIAVHIAANKPASLDLASLDPKVVEKEKEIFLEKSRNSGKPDNVIEKMVEGQIKKFLAEIVLLEQNFLFDDKLSIAQAVEKAAKELGAPIKITQFIRYQLGDGVQQ